MLKFQLLGLCSSKEERWEGRREPRLGFARCDKLCCLLSAFDHEVIPLLQGEVSKCSLLASWLHQAQTMNLLRKVGEERVHINNKGCISISMKLWLKKHNHHGILGNVIVEDRTWGSVGLLVYFEAEFPISKAGLKLDGKPRMTLKYQSSRLWSVWIAGVHTTLFYTVLGIKCRASCTKGKLSQRSPSPGVCSYRPQMPFWNIPL